MNRLKSLMKFFAPPVFTEDAEKTRSANFINIIVLSNIPVLLIFMLIRTITGAEPFGVANMILAAITTMLVIVWFLMRSGRVRPAGFLHITTIWLASTLIAFNGSGVRGTTITSYFVVMLMAGLLLGWESAIGFALLGVLAGFGLATAENLGIIHYVPGPAIGTAIEGTVLFIFGAIFLYLIISSFQSAVARAQANASELNISNKQLSDLRGQLEKHVEERTEELATRTSELEVANKQIRRRAAQFEALTQVTQTITSVRDLQTLMPVITKVISEKFGFYHVGVFLLDEVGQYAILTAANSEGGKRMLERKHRLRVGEEGIVGYATSTGKPRIAMDVGRDAIYFNNPDLPGTHSEIALPLISKNIIVGALDVQSTATAAFTDEDVQMLGLLADQVSLAIENARLFEETRRALSEAEAISRQITHEGFGRLAVEQNLVGYHFSVSGAKPLETPLKLAEPTPGKGKEKQTETNQVLVPIELRGVTIGTLAVQTPSLESLNQDQIDLIKAVAERVALSAENARLFDETSRRAERERMVSEITGKIRSMNDPDLMIKTAIDELRNALGASRVEVIPQIVKGRD